MRILALDLGTRCGWAVSEGPGAQQRIESGVQVFDVKRGESPGMRYLRFRAWLAEMTEHSGGPTVGLLIYEQTHNRGGAATEVAAGFATRVQEQAARIGVDHAAVHSGTLKKWTAGKGNADKAEMLAAVGRRWKYVDNDDEADAVALLYYALAEIIPPDHVRRAMGEAP